VGGGGQVGEYPGRLMSADLRVGISAVPIDRISLFLRHKFPALLR
jgi:hypothetical protein